MTLFRASPKDGVAWVTGASGGIGYALCVSLAKRGYIVAASARSEDKLRELASHSFKAGRIVAIPLDVTDEGAVRATVKRIETELGPIALAVFNAGTALPAPPARVQPPLFERIYAVNLFGVVNCLAPVIEAMKTRNKGQIAIVGSLTAYFGLPGVAAYGSTKAALNMIAQSLRFDLTKRNIRVQIVNPGFVKTAMTQYNKFPMPGLLTTDQAAQRMEHGLRKGGFEIAFPRRLAWPMKLFRLLPQSLRFAVIDRAARLEKR